MFREGQEYEIDSKELVQAWVQAGVCEAEGFEVQDQRTSDQVDGRKIEKREDAPVDAPKAEDAPTEETKPEDDKPADAPKEDKPKKGK